MDSLSSVRAAAGLPAVRVNQDPALDSLLGQFIAAAEDLPADAPSQWDEPLDLAACNCYLYERQGSGFHFISPTEFASSRGASGSYGAWVLGEYNLDSFPQGYADELFLDSRLTDIAARNHTLSDGSQVFILFAKLSDGAPQIRAKYAKMDAFKSVTLPFTSPYSMTYFRIDLLSGKQWMPKYRGWSPSDFTTYPGFAGLRLNYFADTNDSYKRLSLAWGARYRISSGQTEGQFSTALPAPPRKSWVFAKSMTGKYKRIFLAAIRRMNPRYRVLIKQIAPYTKIKTHAGSGSSMAFPYGADGDEGSEDVPFTVSFARGHLEMRKFKNEVVAHELAHIVDYGGLDDVAYRDFRSRFKKSKKWKNCSGNGSSSADGPHWPCTEMSELIADQMAFAALNKRSGIGGYGHPRLISSKGMLSMLARYFHLTSPYDGELLTSDEWKDMETPEEAAKREAEENAGIAARREARERVAVDSFPGLR